MEDSNFFSRTFDGVVAWGLFFLLDGSPTETDCESGGCLAKGRQIVIHGPDRKLFLVRCNDWANLHLTRQRGLSSGSRE
jgi:hypothetical protein